MREIIINSKSPSYNTAKWLIREDSGLEHGCSKHALRNTSELSKLQDVVTNAIEMLISFDVKVLLRNTLNKSITN